MPVTAVRFCRSSVVRVGALVAVLAGAAPVLSASDAVRLLSIRASIAPATSLEVSSHVLVFDVPDGQIGARASIEYVASARTQQTAEVILCVERMGGEGALDPSATVALDGVGALAAGGAPVVAGRWVGSGTRRGRLVFRIRATEAGRYVVPVRLLISTP